ncbi:MAG: hypothetical protein HY606_12030 [Planctomycetes bacterium]|nr:hypothetical protein [Planctomycetota bacterium]
MNFLLLFLIQSYSDYFPLEVGNKWQYRDENNEKVELKIDRKVKYKNYDCLVLVLSKKGSKESFYCEFKGTVGLLMHKYEDTESRYKYTADYPLGIMFYPFILDSSNRWETKLHDNGSKGEKREYIYYIQYKGKKQENYKNKDYNAVTFERAVMVDGKESEKMIITFLEGIGPYKMVREKSNSSMTLNLENHSLRITKKPALNKDNSDEKPEAEYLRKLLSHAESTKDNVLKQITLSIIALDYSKSFSDIDIEEGLIDTATAVKGMKDFNSPNYTAIITQLNGMDEILAKKVTENFKQFCDSLMVKYAPLFAKTVYRLNQIRTNSGFPPVIFSASLSKGCMYHSHYMDKKKYEKLNTLADYHSEDKKYEYYSPEGDDAARKSVITAMGLPDGVDELIGTFYHRIPLLNPFLELIGVGVFNETASFLRPVCINARGGFQTTSSEMISVLYPHDGQKGVSIRFSNDELPDPVPGVNEVMFGYPITITFYNVNKVVAKKIELMNGSSQVDCYLHTPQKPSNPERPDFTTICILPKVFLKSKTMYKVLVECEVDGKAFSKEWTFTTQ